MKIAHGLPAAGVVLLLSLVVAGCTPKEETAAPESGTPRTETAAGTAAGKIETATLKAVGMT